jgi:hypothetical protein
MAIGQQLGNGNPDGVCLGQSATDKISFYGATPVVQAATTAAGTDAATTQTLANAMRTVLRNLGLMA